tara:strand:+ start:7075 stop:8253 length:1179 start_codon:yes stop_codon:yes gene_type:complete
MKSIEDLSNLNEKKILLRLDLNVPLKDGIITDATRINKILPTIQFLLKKNAKIIILSHIGRPKGKNVNALSLQPVCDDIKKKLNVDIKLITKNIKEINSNDIFKNLDEKILMFENIRFYKEEEENDNDFAKHISSLAEIYVNDAFSCSHRAHSSINKMPKFLPSYSGLQLNSEIYALKRLTTSIKKPITCIIGGSKISTKINIIKNLISKFDNMIIVGGMANNILEYKGFEIGKSIREKNCIDLVEEIFNISQKEKCKIFFPEDVVIGKNLNDSSKIKLLDDVCNDEMILDIGPKTINTIKNLIKKSKTVLWNGPAGYFENSNFANGSYEIGKEIANKTEKGKLYSVVGGGDTISVINNINLFNKYNFVSTAGGAFLEYLEGKDLPGIKALN